MIILGQPGDSLCFDTSLFWWRIWVFLKWSIVITDALSWKLILHCCFDFATKGRFLTSHSARRPWASQIAVFPVWLHWRVWYDIVSFHLWFPRRPYESIKSMWEWLIPLLKTALGNITTETVVDWGTCIATSSGKTTRSCFLMPCFRLARPVIRLPKSHANGLRQWWNRLSYYSGRSSDRAHNRHKSARLTD